MPHLLSSWKEIGQYLGKGVRTVQRWEQEFGLPVRRPAGHSRHAVLAVPAELDAWALTRTRGPRAAAALSLHKELAEARQQIDELRRRMESIESFCAENCKPVRRAGRRVKGRPIDAKSRTPDRR